MTIRVHGDALAGTSLLDFAVSVWPSARPVRLERALRDALDGTRYPDERRARAAVAERHGRDEREVLLLNGACEAFWLLAHALRPARAAVVQPAFTEADAALRAVGCDVVHVGRRRDDWSFDAAAVPRDVELVVVGNPNNPTGGVDPDIELPLLTVVDASFADFVPFDPRGDVVLRSLTKLWALPGIRAGYLLAPAELVERLEANRQPWSVNALACAALEACAADDETPRRVAAEVAAAREELSSELARLGIAHWPSRVNFLLLELADGAAVVDRLREQGIAVRPCDDFPGLDERHVRVAVRPPADNARLVAALEAFL